MMFKQCNIDFTNPPWSKFPVYGPGFHSLSPQVNQNTCHGIAHLQDGKYGRFPISITHTST